ncbi:MAG: GNAT family N-acetyltransferase [Anaeroplasma sp.]
MNIITNRLIITKFTNDMAEAVHLNSLDDDNRRFVPDEVFETVDDALDVIKYLISVYENENGPLVFPVTLKDGTYIGYVQAILLGNGEYEIGYHIGSYYTRQGFATEAVTAFLPVIMKKLGINEISGICLFENKASIKVLEKCGFEKIYEGIGNYQGKNKKICKYVYQIHKL